MTDSKHSEEIVNDFLARTKEANDVESLKSILKRYRNTVGKIMKERTLLRNEADRIEARLKEIKNQLHLNTQQFPYFYGTDIEAEIIIKIGRLFLGEDVTTKTEEIN